MPPPFRVPEPIRASFSEKEMSMRFTGTSNYVATDDLKVAARTP